VLGGNLRQNAEPPKPEKPASKTLSDEQERLVAEIKRHHPMATTEGILEHLKEWGVE
jgi:transposase